MKRLKFFQPIYRTFQAFLCFRVHVPVSALCVRTWLTHRVLNSLLANRSRLPASIPTSVAYRAHRCHTTSINCVVSSRMPVRSTVSSLANNKHQCSRQSSLKLMPYPTQYAGADRVYIIEILHAWVLCSMPRLHTGQTDVVDRRHQIWRDARPALIQD